MRDEKCCLSYWFPKIEAAGLPIPKTEILTMPEAAEKEVFGLLYEQSLGVVELNKFVEELKAAGERMGYPCFLRTGMTSGKHQWKKCCHVTDGDLMISHVMELAEFSQMVDMIGLPFNVWVVREFLPTIPQMVADRYGDMPVCREFRFFVDGHDVICWHPYWPLGSLREGMRNPPEDLQQKHDFLSYMPAGDTKEILKIASRAGEVCGGQWSVDILETRKGWYLTDMAEAHRSYHWEGCDKKNSAGK